MSTQAEEVFRVAVAELRKLEGTTVLLQARDTESDLPLLSLLDGVARVAIDEQDSTVAYLTFYEAEGSICLVQGEVSEAAWGPAWRAGEEDSSLLRIRRGQIDLGIMPA